MAFVLKNVQQPPRWRRKAVNYAGALLNSDQQIRQRKCKRAEGLPLEIMKVNGDALCPTKRFEETFVNQPVV